MTPAHHATLAGLAFALGASVGSFLNVCVWRLPRGESLIRPGSRCPKCEHAIAARDNLPVIGWLALKGRCRNCRAPISPRYPAVEAAVGLIFAGITLADLASDPLDPFDRGVGAVALRLAFHLGLAAFAVTTALIERDRRRGLHDRPAPASPTTAALAAVSALAATLTADASGLVLSLLLLSSSLARLIPARPSVVRTQPPG